MFRFGLAVRTMQQDCNVLFNDALNTFIYGYMASEIW